MPANGGWMIDSIAGHSRLAPLSQETWKSSVSMWMGDWWDVIVDLWSVESGRTDLVVELRINEDGEGYRYVVGIIYVP